MENDIVYLKRFYPVLKAEIHPVYKGILINNKCEKWLLIPVQVGDKMKIKLYHYSMIDMKGRHSKIPDYHLQIQTQISLRSAANYIIKHGKKYYS